MNSNAIVGWKINKSENAITILNVLNQVTKASRKEHKIFGTFIQSDLGSGNTSKIVTNSFNKSKTLIHSKSLSGFKGNQVSECLNRWIKRDFKIMFGNKFNSIKHFTEALRKFINWWNNDRMILRLKCLQTNLYRFEDKKVNLSNQCRWCNSMFSVYSSKDEIKSKSQRCLWLVKNGAMKNTKCLMTFQTSYSS
ncbi:IS3 family transposase [Spiroplasma ixodetis]|uniref:IS3 family transposase n=1 Tax=Spiroplasma ixodetis TaxID=2141 RepID=UPI002575A5C8|nr:IS3 family transposase [Spiroplasma ixodetis]